MKVFRKFILITLLPLQIANAEIITPGGVFVSESTLGKFTCGWIGEKWLPGKLKKDGITFNTYLNDIEKQTFKMQTTTNPAKKSLLLIKIAALKKKHKSGKLACKAGPYTANPTKAYPTYGPTPTKTPFITPTPGAPIYRTPTPIPSQAANFDRFGNVTEQGKITFSIPSNLSANIERGRIVHTDNNCTGCHQERTTRSFATLTSNVPFSPMFINLSQQEFADLTAFLNRYRP